MPKLYIWLYNPRHFLKKMKYAVIDTHEPTICKQTEISPALINA